MTAAALRYRLRRLERALLPQEQACPMCAGRGTLEIFIGEDDPRLHPGCPGCGRVMKIVLVAGESDQACEL